MGKIIKKMAAIVCSIATVASIASVDVSAYCTKGYDIYSASIVAGKSGEDDMAVARIRKCSCAMVKNNLMVWLRVQYRSGNSYKWIPEYPYYYYDHQVDCYQASKSIQHKNITFSEAIFFATCGNNNIADDPKKVGVKTCTK